MLGRQAKVLSTEALHALLWRADAGGQPSRDRLIVQLSVRAGLRASEIAKLQWPMVLDASGRVGTVLCLPHQATKKGSGRRIPLHSELRSALIEVRLLGLAGKYVVVSTRGGPMRPNSIVNWFIATFRELGLEGCSLHSGRRTFVTRAARLVHQAGGSLRDVQIPAGHSSIETTQRYIEGDTDVQRRLVALL